jgi:hypothetical protein
MGPGSPVLRQERFVRLSLSFPTRLPTSKGCEQSSWPQQQSVLMLLPVHTTPGQLRLPLPHRRRHKPKETHVPTWVLLHGKKDCADVGGIISF